MCSPRCELAVIAGPGENSVEKGEEGVRLAEIGDLLQRAAKSKGEILTMEANVFKKQYESAVLQLVWTVSVLS